MASISVDELAKVPYIKAVPRDGRVVRLQAFHDRDTGEWALYYPVDGNLVRITCKPVVGLYWGQEPEDPSQDIHLPLCTFVYQHLSWLGVARAMKGLEDDFHNLGAILRCFGKPSSRNRPLIGR